MASPEYSSTPYPDASRLEDVFNQIAHGETKIALLDEYYIFIPWSFTC